MKQPTAEGLYVFTGRRRMVNRQGTSVAVNDIVEYKQVQWGKEYAIFFMGRSTPYKPEYFDGEFTPLHLPLKGARIS